MQPLNVTAILDEADAAVRVANDSMRKQHMAVGDALVGKDVRGRGFQPKWLIRTVK